MPNRLGRESANWASTTRPGYRLYFQRRGDTIVILLRGDDKSTQARDIKAAKRLADEWNQWP